MAPRNGWGTEQVGGEGMLLAKAAGNRPFAMRSDNSART
jgi:hypothetical protein